MPKILFNATDEEKQLWVELAAKEKVTLSEWLRQAARAKATGAPTTIWVGEVKERPAVPLPAESAAKAAKTLTELAKQPLFPEPPERSFKPDFKVPKEKKKR